MKIAQVVRSSSPLVAIVLAGVFSGCAHYEVNTGRGTIPGHYIRYEMQEADRAVEAARAAGKDKQCPAEFAEAEKAKDHAYDVYRACHTEEGAALAKEATAKANALCPPQPVAKTPAPAPAVPEDSLAASPASIVKGPHATLSWTSRNATNCDIQPGIGAVQPQGSMTVTPDDTTAYTLTCSGAGGTAQSATQVAVIAPAPAPVIGPPKAAAKLCQPTVIDIQFDTNKADIKPRYHEELKKLADFLKEFPAAKGVIEGHTDSVGSKASNMKLSQRRSESVRSYLIKTFGIAPERIGAKGYGPTKPIADNKTAAGKQKNRRIEANFTCDGK
jgi:OOP family OmpA-OmpF porin